MAKTKAATEGEKRRRKQRSDRQPGPRWPSGRRMTPDEAKRAQETAEEVKRPALSRRCLRLGWADTAENRRRVDDARLGNPAGLAWAAGWFGEGDCALDLYLSICDYRDALIEWGKAFEAPWPHPRCCAWAREAVSAPENAARGQVAYSDDRTPQDRKAAARASVARVETVLSTSHRAALSEMIGDGADEWTPAGAEHYRHVVIDAAKALARLYQKRL